MRRPSSRVLIGASAALCVGVPVLLLWPAHQDICEAPAIVAPALPPIALTLTGAALVHPLFNDARSPTVAAETKPDTASEQAAATPPPILVGIATGGGGGVALLKSSAGQTVQARVGEEVDGWRLVGLARATARVARGSQSIDLTFELKGHGRRVADPDAAPPPAPQSLIPLPPPSNRPD